MSKTSVCVCMWVRAQIGNILNRKIYSRMGYTYLLDHIYMKFRFYFESSQLNKYFICWCVDFVWFFFLHTVCRHIWLHILFSTNRQYSVLARTALRVHLFCFRFRFVQREGRCAYYAPRTELPTRSNCFVKFQVVFSLFCSSF